jgi:hypothetical protein
MRAPFSTAIAISAGVIVLLGYFLGQPVISAVRSLLIDWAVIIAGMAGLIAIANLVRIHWKRLSSARNRDYFSILMLAGFFFTFLAGLILKPSDPRFQNVVTSIQVPVEASLMGVLAISLTYASIRLFQRRKGWMAVLFVASTIVFLVIASGFLSTANQIPLLKNLLAAVNMLPVAGARGILLGIALGSLTTGLRVLLAADRPYSG